MTYIADLAAMKFHADYDANKNSVVKNTLCNTRIHHSGPAHNIRLRGSSAKNRLTIALA